MMIYDGDERVLFCELGHVFCLFFICVMRFSKWEFFTGIDEFGFALPVG